MEDEILKMKNIFAKVLIIICLITSFSCSTKNHHDLQASMRRENANASFLMHYKNAREYAENGNIDEAINEYLICRNLGNVYSELNSNNYEINQAILQLYLAKEDYIEALKLIITMMKKEPTRDYYLMRANIYKMLDFTEMSAIDINIANKLERVYYVSVLGSDIQNNGLTEQSPFQTLEKAVDAAKRGSIKTIVVIGNLTNEDRHSNSRGPAFSVDNNGSEILIIGKSYGVLSGGTKIYRDFFYPTVISVSGNFRFANIDIREGGICLEISSNSNVFLDNGVNIYGNSHSRFSDLFSPPRSTGINNNGNLVIQGDTTIKNNWTANSGNAGGITNSGTLLIKDFVMISENRASSFSDGWSTTFGGGGGIYNSGNLTIQDSVKIINNSSRANAGGINNSGTINMLGGEIRNNASAKNGGGVYNNGTFNMRNGTISNNEAEYGGGIYISGGSNSVFTLFNGAIENNKARLTGGAVYVESRARFNQNAGEMRNNTASDGSNNIFRQ
jgi:hypothetical protein